MKENVILHWLIVEQNSNICLKRKWIQFLKIKKKKKTTVVQKSKLLNAYTIIWTPVHLLSKCLPIMGVMHFCSKELLSFLRSHEDINSLVHHHQELFSKQLAGSEFGLRLQSSFFFPPIASGEGPM